MSEELQEEIINRMIINSDRFIKAEQKLIDIAEMTWIERLFCKRNIYSFLSKQMKEHRNNLNEIL